MASYAYNTLGAKTAAIATEKGSDYSVGLAQYFKDEFTKLGGKVVEHLIRQVILTLMHRLLT